jgi:hypothetical protein
MASEDSNKLLWLTDSFVSTVLQKDLKADDLEIINFDCGPATKGGDNYSSELYRLSISFREFNDEIVRTKSYVVKCMLPVTSTTGKMHKEMGLFNREHTMLSESLIMMDNLYKSIGEVFGASPKYVYSMTEPTELIVMEDLRCDGYMVGDRLVGLDRKHCKLVMEKIAMFHAASMKEL